MSGLENFNMRIKNKAHFFALMIYLGIMFFAAYEVYGFLDKLSFLSDRSMEKMFNESH